MTGDITPLVVEAAKRVGSFRRTFTTTDFAEVLREHFQLKAWPDDLWTINVLEKVDCVVWLPYEGLWQYIEPGDAW